MLRCDVITLFPDLVQPVLGRSLLKQAPEEMLLEAAHGNVQVGAEAALNA